MNAAKQIQRSPERRGRSHYQFKSWNFSDGKTRVAYPVRAKNKESPDLISTVAHNPTRNTNTLLTLAIDVDFKRTEPQWIENGKISWEKVSDFLFNEHTPLYFAIDAVVRSTGGRGWHIVLGVQPLELNTNPRQYFFQYRAESVQKRLIKLLCDVGIGADPAACGLIRDFPNYFTPSRLIYGDRKCINRAQSFAEKDKLKEVDAYLDSIGYPMKDKVSRPFGERRVSAGMAKLYLHLASEFADGNRTTMLQTEQVAQITDLSLPYVRKVLGSPESWLKSSWCGKAEGWRLGITDSLKLLREAESVASGPIFQAPGRPFPKMLPPPETVEKGDRNRWITTLAVLLKQKGVEEAIANNLIKRAILRIPGHQLSHSCKTSSAIIRSVYRNRIDLKGKRPWLELPEWLLVNASREYAANRQEGDEVPHGSVGDPKTNALSSAERKHEAEELLAEEKKANSKLCASGVWVRIVETSQTKQPGLKGRGHSLFAPKLVTPEDSGEGLGAEQEDAEDHANREPRAEWARDWCSTQKLSDKPPKLSQDSLGKIAKHLTHIRSERGGRVRPCRIKVRRQSS